MMKSNVKPCWIIEFVNGDVYNCDGDIPLNYALLALFANRFVDKDPFFDKLKKNLDKLTLKVDELSFRTNVCGLENINIFLKDKIKSICLTDQCVLSDDYNNRAGSSMC